MSDLPPGVLRLPTRRERIGEAISLSFAVAYSAAAYSIFTIVFIRAVWSLLT